MEFNDDGTLKVAKKVVRDHITIFHLLSELNFAIGKKLFVQVLRGEVNARIKKLRLDKKIYHGTLGGYEPEQLEQFINYLISQELLVINKQLGRYPVIAFTPKGAKEYQERKLALKIDDLKTLAKKAVPKHHKFTSAPITETDKKLFEVCNFFLERFTDEQKKAIIDMSKRQLCVAGAGSGKTSVLTHKIVYLVRFAGVKPQDILAITFTRKARQEMIARLAELLPETPIKVETFNSFAEKELLSKGEQLYGKQKRMISQKEFYTLVIKAMSTIGFEMETFLDHYFTARERRGKESRELFFSFLYDFRVILDTYLAHGKDENLFSSKLEKAKLSEQITAGNIVKLVRIVVKDLESEGLRTYTDQLIDINELYTQFPHLVKKFDWVLVDEYQDVNYEQLQLLTHIAPNYLFVVGDPRQSIYAWRGSNPDILYDFVKEEATVMQLTTNFRSTEEVVNFSNVLIANTNNGNNAFEPLQSKVERTGTVTVTKYTGVDSEAIAVINEIESLACSRKEVFVLSRTNKGLEAIKELCLKKGIRYLLRTDEKKDLGRMPRDDEITLSTVHAIKGLEAEIVFVVGANTNNYPCKAKDHRFVHLLVGKEGYNQYEEERRILYVACTRAKKDLYISYTGALSPFFSRMVLLQVSKQSDVSVQKSLLGQKRELPTENVMAKQRSALRRWRYLEAQERTIPPYMIFSDKSLDQLLELQPSTLEDLYEVSGLGKSKINAFGQDILDVMYS